MRDARLSRRNAQRAQGATWQRGQEQADIDRLDQLREENAQLRELVIQLTKLAIKNIMTAPRRVN